MKTQDRFQEWYTGMINPETGRPYSRNSAKVYITFIRRLVRAGLVGTDIFDVGAEEFMRQINTAQRRHPSEFAALESHGNLENGIKWWKRFLDERPSSGSKPAKVMQSAHFKEFLGQFRRWLIDEAGLGQASADQYKVYIKKLSAAANKVFGQGWFEAGVSDYLRDRSQGKLNWCSAFIEIHKCRCSAGLKKTWCNWRSAFHRLREFLYDVTDSWNEYPRCDRQEVGEAASGVLAYFSDNRSSAVEAQERVVVESYTRDELCRVFLSRLKTQGRFYPNYSRSGLLFPTRLLTKIFRNTSPNTWMEWLENGIANIRLLRDRNGNYEVLSDVKMLAIYNDGTVVVTKRDGSMFELMTRTFVRKGGRVTEGPIVRQKARRGLCDISIDHITPLSNIISTHRGRLAGFEKLTNLFQEFSGGRLNCRAEMTWVNEFFDEYRDRLTTSEIRSLIVNDLNSLNAGTEYELMDTRENSKRGNR